MFIFIFIIYIYIHLYPYPYPYLHLHIYLYLYLYLYLCSCSCSYLYLYLYCQLQQQTRTLSLWTLKGSSAQLLLTYTSDLTNLLVSAFASIVSSSMWASGWLPVLGYSGTILRKEGEVKGKQQNWLCSQKRPDFVGKVPCGTDNGWTKCQLLLKHTDFFIRWTHSNADAPSQINDTS